MFLVLVLLETSPAILLRLIGIGTNAKLWPLSIRIRLSTLSVFGVVMVTVPAPGTHNTEKFVCSRIFFNLVVKI